MSLQLSEFTERTIKEYNHYSRANLFANNFGLEEDQESENFVHIGKIFEIPNDVLDSESNTIPEIIGLTRGITLGEEKHFIDTIIDSDNSNTIEEIEKDKITAQYLSKWVGRNTIFLLPLNILYDNLLKNRNNWNYIKWIDRTAYLSIRYPLYPVVDSIVEGIKNKILIYEKDDINWFYIKKHNDDIDTDERLHINITPRDNVFKLKIDTVNNITTPGEIKILEIIG